MFNINLDLDEEIRDVKGYEGEYAVTSHGRVYSYKSNKFLRPSSTKTGYCQVILCKEGRTQRYYVHRLVASAFLPNPNNKPQVNHRDECKSNNSRDNLEWCDAKYNMNYGTRTQRISKAVYCVTNGKTYASVKEAARELNMSASLVSMVLKNKASHAKGYVFEYACSATC